MGFLYLTKRGSRYFGIIEDDSTIGLFDFVNEIYFGTRTFGTRVVYTFTNTIHTGHSLLAVHPFAPLCVYGFIFQVARDGFSTWLRG